MADLPLNILTGAGFTDAEAHSIVDHLIQGVDTHDPAGPDRLDIEALPPAKKDAYTRFVEAVTPDA
jgi:hypothetical protein